MMKKNRNLMIIIALAALVALIVLARAVSFTTPAGGRWPPEGVASVKDAPQPAEWETLEVLTLTASTEKREYVLGEPVWVYVILENTSSKTERVWGKLRPEEGAVSILVSGEGKEEVFTPLGRTDNDETAFVELKAGEQIGDTFPVFFGADGWTFAEPGEYTLTVLYETPVSEGKFGRVSSDPFTVTVKEEGGVAALVTGDEASLEAGKFLLWQGGDHLIKGKEMLSDLAERYPYSPLASYVHFALGRSLSESFMDYGKNEVRPPDCGASIKHLSQVDPAVVGTLVKVQIEFARARCFAIEGKLDAALESLARARKIAGSGPEFVRLMGKITEYEKNIIAAQEEKME